VISSLSLDRLAPPASAGFVSGRCGSEVGYSSGTKLAPKALADVTSCVSIDVACTPSRPAHTSPRTAKLSSARYAAELARS
jgi:hypothetical protein